MALPHGGPMLPLDYDRRIPHWLLAEMEQSGTALGLPLEALECLGRDERRCRAFVRAAREAGFPISRDVPVAPPFPEGRAKALPPASD